MKKLFVAFCVIFSINSYAEYTSDETCYVDYYMEDNVWVWDSKINIYKGSEDYEVNYLDLLSYCDAGDILHLTMWEIFDLPLKKIIVKDLIKTTNAQLLSSFFIEGYCDLKETIIVSESILVCRLVKR